jgi:hypothetical protein
MGFTTILPEPLWGLPSPDIDDSQIWEDEDE